MKRTCKVEDDNGKTCGRVYSDKQHKQDGMCSRCAEGLWETTYQPILMDKSTKPFIFKKETK